VPSDQAPPTYMDLTPAQVRQLPRIVMDQAVLTGRSAPTNKYHDIIYRGELYCRYPDFEHTQRYAMSGKLRTTQHSLFY
jgi:hypothetical protein